jgi:uncharacterized OsmC-like protein
MAEARVRPRGSRVYLPKSGKGIVYALSGTQLPLAGSPSQDGFNPLELLDASLAGCLALSIRIAARNLGLNERLEDVTVESVGAKAADAPSRIATIVNRYEITGDLNLDEKARLIEEAHKICTIGNSIGTAVEIVDKDG